eukprot:3729796-Alexandrium_andersonii.AAC.1
MLEASGRSLRTLTRAMLDIHTRKLHPLTVEPPVQIRLKKGLWVARQRRLEGSACLHGLGLPFAPHEHD